MKKKYALIIIVILIVISFILSYNWGSEDKRELLSSREKIIKSLGVSTSDRIIIKKLDVEKEEDYYVFIINKSGFEQYVYRFFDKREDYDSWVETYSSGIYRLEKDEKALMTKIFAQSGQKNTNESLEDSILKKYSDTEKYEIIK